MASEMIWVMANPSKTRRENASGNVFMPLSPGQIALIEEHPDHPLDPMCNEHRVFIVAGDPPQLAALTTTVAERITQRQLIQMDFPTAAARYKKMTGNDLVDPRASKTAPDEDEEFEFDAPAEKPKAQRKPRVKAAQVKQEPVSPPDEQGDDDEDTSEE